MTCKLFFTRDKKKKKPRKCHIKDSAESMGIWGKSKEFSFYKDQI